MKKICHPNLGVLCIRAAQIGSNSAFEVTLMFSQSLKWMFLGIFWVLFLNPPPFILTSCMPWSYSGDSLCINTVVIPTCKHHGTAKGYQMELSPTWVSLVTSSAMGFVSKLLAVCLNRQGTWHCYWFCTVDSRWKILVIQYISPTLSFRRKLYLKVFEISMSRWQVQHSTNSPKT